MVAKHRCTETFCMQSNQSFGLLSSNPSKEVSYVCCLRWLLLWFRFRFFLWHTTLPPIQKKPEIESFSVQLTLFTTPQSTIYIWSDNDAICTVTKWHSRCIRMPSWAFTQSSCYRKCFPHCSMLVFLLPPSHSLFAFSLLSSFANREYKISMLICLTMWGQIGNTWTIFLFDADQCIYCIQIKASVATASSCLHIYSFSFQASYMFYVLVFWLTPCFEYNVYKVFYKSRYETRNQE